MFHIIDDDPLIREITSAILESNGFESAGFSSGHEYLDALNTSTYQDPIAVISDVTMPNMDGYELALKIREKKPLQIIILMSGNADPMLHEAACSEACFIINKPFRADEFLSIINKVVLHCHSELASESREDICLNCGIAKTYKCPFSSEKGINI